MKNIFGLLLFVCVPFITSATIISDYYVDLEIQDNAHMRVSEQITYIIDNKSAPVVTHSIPLRYSVQDGKRQSMMVYSPKATIDGQEAEVVFQSDQKSALIAITLPEDKKSGQVKIELEYFVEGVVAYYEINNQISWQALTSDTDSAISRFAGSVRIPSQFKMLRSECVVIQDGQEYRCNVPTRLEGGFVSYFAHMDKQKGDDIVLEAQFDTGVEVTVRSVSWNGKEWVAVILGVLMILGALGALFAISLVYVKKRFSTYNKK